MKRIVLVLAAACMLATAACAQTTQPTTDAAPQQPWPRAVAAFARSLVGGELDATQAAMAQRSIVRRFDGMGSEELWRLSERAVNAKIVGQHAYIHPPLTMAADLAADFKTAAGVPEKLKAKFIVDDDNDAKRANSTAVQWVAEQLTVRPGTPVGVIVLWAPRPTSPGTKPSDHPPHDLIFILLRGDEVAPREFRIDSIVYGNPLPEMQ
jgi:hypothetical protein